MARLRLFGLPRLELEDATLTLPFGRGLMLVCVCAIEREVSRDRLISLLYPEHPEAEARTNLRQVLQGLKKKSLGTLLELQANTVRFAGAADVQDFESCLQNADFQGVTSLYGDLLRGVNGDNPEIESWLELQREKFKRLYHDAVQRETLRLETLGEYELAWQTLQPLLTETFAEDLYVHAVRLCLLSGRRSLALELIEDFETRLRAELNLRPLEETRRLFESVRAGTPLPTEAQPATLELPLIGREIQLQQLRKLPQGISLLFGEGGIGKTKLLEMALPSAVWLRCRQASLLPLQPFADWFAALGEKTKILSADQIGVLERLNPNPSAPEHLEINQTLLLQTLETVLQTFGSTIVLDDLHWADPATLEFLPAFAAGLGASNTRLLIALRPEESLGNDALTRCLKHLRSLEHFALEIRLEVLNENDSARLIAAALALPEPPQAFGSRIYRVAGGHPLFTLETLRELQAKNMLIQNASGAWRTPFDSDTKDYAELLLPSSAINALERRIRLLPEAERRVLDALAVAGGSSELGLLERITELNGLGLSDALEGLKRVGLVLGEAQPRLAHDLMLEATYQMMSEPRRVMLHRLFASETGSAKHWELARDRPKAAQAWFDHAMQLEQQGLFAVSVIEALEHALALSSDQEFKARVHAELSFQHLRTDHVELAEHHAAEALEWTNDPDARFRALHVQSDMALAAGHQEKAIELARTALKLQLNNAQLKSSQRSLKMKICYYTGDYARACEILRENIAELETRAPSTRLVEDLISLGANLDLQGLHFEAEPIHQQAFEIAKRHGFHAHQVDAALNWLFNTLDTHKAEQVIPHALEALNLGSFDGTEILRLNLGAAFVDLERQDEAIMQFELLTTESLNPSIRLIAWGRLCALFSDPGEALEQVALHLPLSDLAPARARGIVAALGFGNAELQEIARGYLEGLDLNLLAPHMLAELERVKNALPEK